jgi:hypothetical protein
MSNQSTPRSLKAICAARHLRTAELDLQDVAQHFSAASALVLDNKLADRLGAPESFRHSRCRIRLANRSRP